MAVLSILTHLIIKRHYMTEEQFWQLVSATDLHADSDTLATELTDKLTPLTDEELAAFDKHFNLRMRDSYTWDLWGAAFVISGCNSEYAFAEFRCWLISRGQEAYYNSLKKPDTIACLYIGQDKEGYADPYLDEYDLIAGQIFEGRHEGELPYVLSGQNQPQGKRFKDKTKVLKASYPKLFELYWASHL